MTAEEVRQLLHSACLKAGGRKCFAEQADISQQYICDVLNGRREPGQSVLEALGLERVITYRVLKE